MLTLALVLLLLILCSTGWSRPPSDFFGGGFPGGRSSSSRRDDSLYQLLGVERTASPQEITKAYRRKAMQVHPDKGGDEEEFKQLNEAFSVLSDETTRANYDRYGLAGVAGRGDGGGGGGAAQAAADLARDLFRGMGGAGFGGFSMPLVYQLDLSLEDLYRGRELTIPISRMKVQVSIQPGMMSGQELILRGQFVDDRGLERDVVFRVQETRHALFQRRNADLLIDLSVSLADSLLGFRKTITHLDGRPIVLCSKKGECVGTGDVLVVPGQGMPVYSQPATLGRLFVRIRVDVPRKLWCSGADAVELERLLGLNGQTRSKRDGGSEGEGAGLGDGENEGEGVGVGVGVGVGADSAATSKGRKGSKGTKSSKKAGPTFTLSRGDLGSFGGVGAPEEEDSAGNPFAQFFFR